MQLRRSESLSSTALVALSSSIAFLCCSFFNSICSLLISWYVHLVFVFLLDIWLCRMTMSCFIPSISVAIDLHLQGQVLVGTFCFFLVGDKQVIGCCSPFTVTGRMLSASS